MHKDIYFDPLYARLYESIEGGELLAYTFENEMGKVSNTVIKREIPSEAGIGWFDLITPYGYGGPVIEKLNEGFSEEDIVSAFAEDFGRYCEKNNIVSEFVRFHPIIGNGPVFAPVYGSEYMRHTLGTNLAGFDDPFTEEFSKSCRKTVRRSLSKGVTYRVTPSPDSLESFKQVYYSTMDRNNAPDYYYFGDEYFDAILCDLKDNVLMAEALYEGKTIAAGLYFVSGKTIHVHLSGTLTEYLSLSPAYVLKYATVVWGKENGYELVHYGGGRSNAEDDPLYAFKKKFAAHTEFQFYIGRKIWNQAKYDELSANADKNSGFFPLYRKR